MAIIILLVISHIISYIISYIIFYAIFYIIFYINKNMLAKTYKIKPSNLNLTRPSTAVEMKIFQIRHLDLLDILDCSNIN